MVLITHITIAFLSIGFTSYTAFFPSKAKLNFTYMLILGTLLSGSVMMFLQPINLGQMCISGIIYLGFVSVVSIVARKRLAAVN